MSKNRLSPNDWITAGLAALTRKGPSALKAEALARDLGTTKGSFYWHFKDVPAFHEALLAGWEAYAQTKITALSDLDAKPVTKLRLLAELRSEKAKVGFDRPGTEAALRAWSEENDLAFQATTRIDAARLEMIQGLLSQIDLTNKELSHILYGATLGLNDLESRQKEVSSKSLETLVDLILALYEEA